MESSKSSNSFNVQLSPEYIEIFYRILLKHSSKNATPNQFDSVREDYLHYLTQLADRNALSSFLKNRLKARLEKLKQTETFKVYHSLINALIQDVNEEGSQLKALLSKLELKKFHQKIFALDQKNKEQSTTTVPSSFETGESKYIARFTTSREQRIIELETAIAKLKEQKENPKILEQLVMQLARLLYEEGDHKFKNRMYANAIDYLQRAYQKFMDLHLANPNFKFPEQYRIDFMTAPEYVNQCRQALVGNIMKEMISIESKVKSGALDDINLSVEEMLEKLDTAKFHLDQIHPKSTKDYYALVKLLMWRSTIAFTSKNIQEGMQKLSEALILSHSILARFNFSELNKDNRKAADQTIKMALQLVAIYIKLATDCASDTHKLKEGIEYCKRALTIYDQFLDPTLKLIQEPPVGNEEEKKLLISLCHKQIDVLISYSKSANPEESLALLLEAKQLVKELSLLQTPSQLMICQNQITRQECVARFNLSQIALSDGKMDVGILHLRALIEAASTLNSMKSVKIDAIKKLIEIYLVKFDQLFTSQDIHQARLCVSHANIALDELKQLVSAEECSDYETKINQKTIQLLSVPVSTENTDTLEVNSQAEKETTKKTETSDQPKRPNRRRTHAFIGQLPNSTPRTANDGKTSTTEVKKTEDPNRKV